MTHLAQPIPTPTTPTSLPDGPLARFLQDPGAATDRVVEGALDALRTGVRIAVPVLAVALVVVLVRALFAWRARRRDQAGARRLVVVPPVAVQADSAAACWRALGELLDRRRGQPTLAFEVTLSAHRIGFSFVVPASVPVARVAELVEGAWPGATTTVEPAAAPLGADGAARGARL